MGVLGNADELSPSYAPVFAKSIIAFRLPLLEVICLDEMMENYLPDNPAWQYGVWAFSY